MGTVERARRHARGININGAVPLTAKTRVSMLDKPLAWRVATSRAARWRAAYGASVRARAAALLCCLCLCAAAMKTLPARWRLGAAATQMCCAAACCAARSRARACAPSSCAAQPAQHSCRALPALCSMAGINIKIIVVRRHLCMAPAARAHFSRKHFGGTQLAPPA
jgi:hypothetical protein